MSSFQKGASELGATCKGICSKGLFIAADIFKKTTKSSTCFLHFLLNLHVMFVFFCSDSEKTAVLCWCLSTLLSFKISWIITVDSWFRKPANNLRLVVLKSPLTRGFNTIPGWWSAAHSQLVPSCFGALRPARHVMRTCSNAGHGGENKKRVEDVQPLMTSKLFHQFSHEKCISNISMFV